MRKKNILRATIKDFMKYGVCADNSYCVKAYEKDGIEYSLAGELVRIVSAPYSMKIKPDTRGSKLRLVQFIIVSYNSERYRIVNHFKAIKNYDEI